MSVGNVVGGAIGAYFSQPALGAAAGGLLQNLLFPEKQKKIIGPQLSDLTVQTSTYGAYVADVYGTVPVMGNVIWLENGEIKKTKHSSGGGKKGGLEVVSFTYSATFAVGLCRGPITGVRRLWLGTTLVYDAGSDDDETIAASNQASQVFTLYLGTDTQQPDARMQATLGVANTPAYRGIAYLLFEDLQLAPYNDNLLTASVKAEIVRSGETTEYVPSKHSLPSNPWYLEGASRGRDTCFVDWFNNACFVTENGKDWTQHYFPLANWVKIATNGEIYVVVAIASGSEIVTSYDGKTWAVQSLGTLAGLADVVWTGTFFYAVSNQSSDPYFASVDGRTWLAVSESQDPSSYLSYPLIWSGQRLLVFFPDGVGGTTCASSATGMSGTWTTSAVPSTDQLRDGCAKNGRVVVCGEHQVLGVGVYVSDDHGLSWTFYPQDEEGLHALGNITANDEVFFGYGGERLYWSEDGVNWSYKDVAGYVERNVNNVVVWNGASFLAVSNGDSEMLRVVPRAITSSAVPLSEIVEEHCLRSGVLESSDLITHSLTDTVRGYRIGSQGTIRSALGPLQAAFPFDVRQHGYKIEFLRRGAVGSVMTIPYDDLDARPAGSAAKSHLLTQTKTDFQLPRKLTIQYLDSIREYDVGSQYAERPSSTAVNEENFDLPLVLSASEAAGKAETLLFLRWLERDEIKFTVPEMIYSALEAGDVITVESPIGNRDLRISGINTSADGVMEITAIPYRQGLFTPGALGVESLSNGQTTIYRVGPTLLTLLDLPHIESIQDLPGFVVAACGTNPAWRGGTLLQNKDGGAGDYKSLLALSAPGVTLGFTTDPLNAAVDTRVVDLSSVLYVTIENGTLASVTRAALLSGSNLFAYGEDGRWEVIGVGNCDLVSGSDYVLTDFLRGRYGTEWAIAQHLAGDRLVALDTNDLSFLQLTLSAIGAPWLYKAVTTGLTLDSAAARQWVYRGVAFKPLSPVLLNGYRSLVTGDWDLTWVRRTRSHVKWISSTPPPLGEDSEQYRVDIYTDSGNGTWKRSISSTTPAITYTSAEQGTDFGGDQTTLYLKIYQLSATVGDGTPLTTSITRP